MNCAGFEKWLLENPKEKNLPAAMEEHLSACRKCSALWKIEAVLLECPKDGDRLFFPPQMKSYLLSISKKESARRYSFTALIEDSVVQALIIAVLLGGGVAALPKILGSDYLEKIKPFLGPALNTIGPFFSKIVSVFDVPGGIYLFALMVFAAALSFEVYYKTLHPRSSFSSY